MKRAALLTTALVLTLAGCGGSRDDVAVPASPGSSGSPAAGSSAPGASPSAAASPAADACPVKATPAPVPAGVSADLAVKPVVPASSAPPPATVTVADVVVGTGATATTLSAVEAKYVGTVYATGTEFDSSWKTSAATTIPFTVCAQGTIPGFAVGPTGMKVGGRRVVTIPADLAYGAMPPDGSGIPANAPLVFVIDLVKVTPPAG